MTTPKDFFLWLANILTLYISVASLASLLFVIIDHVFSLKFTTYNSYSGGMSMAIAALVVVFPLYIVFTRLINQTQRLDVEKRDIWVRKWGVYLTLFLAGGGMVIDLITLLYTFLQGEELTTAFLLKVLVILVVFGAAFAYYMKEMQGYWLHNEKLSRNIGYTVLLVVVGSLVAGFITMGSPRTQRLLRYDSQRVSDLTNLQYSITDYYRNKQALPQSLEMLKDPLMGTYIPTDPQTSAEYGYEKTGATTFSLCADFNLPQVTTSADADKLNYEVQTAIEQSMTWPHQAGHTCFERTIDPEMYKKF